MQGRKRAVSKEAKQAPTSESTSLQEMLQRCQQGDRLALDAHMDAAAAADMFDGMLQRCVPCDHCHQKWRLHHAGVSDRMADKSKFKTLLKLLASWHAWCLRQEKFMLVAEACKAMLQRRRSHDCSLSEWWGAYVREVQSLCRLVHGFELDVS